MAANNWEYQFIFYQMIGKIYKLLPVVSLIEEMMQILLVPFTSVGNKSAI